MELDKFIEQKAESINTVGYSDSISDEYLKEICEEYHELKLQKNRETNVNEDCVIHNPDWNGKCFKCSQQVFTRDKL